MKERALSMPPWFIVSFFVLCAGGVCLLPLWAFGQSENREVDLTKDFPILTQRVKTQQAADFVMVLDASGSMRPFWSTVQHALAAFIGAIPDGDYLSLITFGTQASYATTPSPVNASTRADLAAAVNRLRQPTDQNTDLGRAVEKTLVELNRPNGNRLKFVFFLTDFLHDPSRGSPYDGQMSTGNAVWQDLARTRRNEQRGNALQVFALLLPLTQQGVGRDLPLVKTVFPELEAVNVNQEMLLSWFQRKEAEIARDKLRLAVASDAEQPPFRVTGIHQRRGRLYAVIKPNGHQIVEVIAIPALKITESSGDANLSPTFQFTPLPIAPFNFVPTSQEPIKIPVAKMTCVEVALIRSETGGDVAVTFEGTQSLAPADELTKLNLAAERPFILPVKMPVVGHCGWVPLWLLGMVVCLLLLGVEVVLYLLRPAYIVGEIAIVGQRPRTLPSSEKRKMLHVGTVRPKEGVKISSDEKVDVPRATWYLVIQALRKPRGVFAKMERGGGQLNNNVPLTTLSSVKLQPNNQVKIGDTTINIYLQSLKVHWGYVLVGAFLTVVCLFCLGIGLGLYRFYRF